MKFMEFFNQAITILQTPVIARGAGLGIWGMVDLEGYGKDNSGTNACVAKQHANFLDSSSLIYS